MHTEIEERILEIDKDKIIKKLEDLGATKIGEWYYKRYTYDFTPKRESEWIRLRTNGVETTLTYKKVETREVDGTKEFEIEVSNFDETNKMLEILGYEYKNYQESKRTRYYLNDVEIDIDTWPMIPTYMELEGPSVEKVKELEDLLEVDKSKITTLYVDEIAEQIYGINILAIKELKFKEE